jgi:hypothetical protein
LLDPSTFLRRRSDSIGRHLSGQDPRILATGPLIHLQESLGPHLSDSATGTSEWRSGFIVASLPPAAVVLVTATGLNLAGLRRMVDLEPFDQRAPRWFFAVAFPFNLILQKPSSVTTSYNGCKARAAYHRFSLHSY